VTRVSSPGEVLSTGWKPVSRGTFLVFFLIMHLGAGQATRPAATTRVARLPAAHTVTLHALAMASGDAEGVRRTFLTHNEQEQAVADAYAGMASAIFRLQSVAKDKFGEDGFREIGFGKMFDAEVERLKKVEEVQKGDEAFVYTSGKGKMPLVLVFIGGDWKIDVGRSYPGRIDRRAARIRAQAAAYNDLAAEIKKGVYKTAEEAKQAGSEKVRAAMEQVDKEFGKSGAGK